MRDAARFYVDFYSSVRQIEGCYAHDVSALAYVVSPDWFETVEGPVCVATEGVAMGQTIMSRYGIPYPLNYWDDRPSQKACLGVESDQVLKFFADAMMDKSWNS